MYFCPLVFWYIVAVLLFTMRKGYLLRIMQFFIVFYPEVSASSEGKTMATLHRVLPSSRGSRYFDHVLKATYFTHVKSNNEYCIFTQSRQIFGC